MCGKAGRGDNNSINSRGAYLEAQGGYFEAQGGYFEAQGAYFILINIDGKAHTCELWIVKRKTLNSI